MALRHEDLTPDELARQEEFNRSWADAQRTLDDPELRAYLEASIQRLNSRSSTAVLTRDEFLAQTEFASE